jgi:hypothetical protein
LGVLEDEMVPFHWDSPSFDKQTLKAVDVM